MTQHKRTDFDGMEWFQRHNHVTGYSHRREVDAISFSISEAKKTYEIAVQQLKNK